MISAHERQKLIDSGYMESTDYLPQYRATYYGCDGPCRFGKPVLHHHDEAVDQICAGVEAMAGQKIEKCMVQMQRRPLHTHEAIKLVFSDGSYTAFEAPAGYFVTSVGEAAFAMAQHVNKRRAA